MIGGPTGWKVIAWTCFKAVGIIVCRSSTGLQKCKLISGLVEFARKVENSPSLWLCIWIMAESTTVVCRWRQWSLHWSNFSRAYKRLHHCTSMMVSSSTAHRCANDAFKNFGYSSNQENFVTAKLYTCILVQTVLVFYDSLVVEHRICDWEVASLCVEYDPE